MSFLLSPYEKKSKINKSSESYCIRSFFILFILFDDGIAFHFKEVFHFLAVVSENGNSMPLRHPIRKDIFRVARCVKLASAAVFARGVAARL
jgi:hypothetical protein